MALNPNFTSNVSKLAKCKFENNRKGTIVKNKIYQKKRDKVDPKQANIPHKKLK